MKNEIRCLYFGENVSDHVILNLYPKRMFFHHYDILGLAIAFPRMIEDEGCYPALSFVFCVFHSHGSFGCLNSGCLCFHGEALDYYDEAHCII